MRNAYPDVCGAKLHALHGVNKHALPQDETAFTGRSELTTNNALLGFHREKEEKKNTMGWVPSCSSVASRKQ